MPRPKLDEFDLKIIDSLQSDGRLTNVELAERISLSPSPCLRRVRRLENEGVIERYTAKINRAKLGLGPNGLRRSEVGTPHGQRRGALRKSRVRAPRSFVMPLVSGEADFLLEVVLSDLDQYSKFVPEKPA